MRSDHTSVITQFPKNGRLFTPKMFLITQNHEGSLGVDSLTKGALGRG